MERSPDIDDRWQASVDRTLVAEEDALPRIQIPQGNLRTVGLDGIDVGRVRLSIDYSRDAYRSILGPRWMDGWLTISLANYCCCGINVCIIILGGVVRHGGEGSLAGSITESERVAKIDEWFTSTSARR